MKFIKQRPTSLTVIACLLIVAACFSLPGSLRSMATPEGQEFMRQNPLPPVFQYAMLYIGSLVQLVSGIGILKAKNWSRWIYTIWGVIGLAISLLTIPSIVLFPGMIFFAIIVLFLFRPVANAYFKESP